MEVNEYVILVNENDQMIGTMEKMEAHVKGMLHRAFSIFIFNTKGQLLLQQRANHKYHSGGKWTNTCCSHPRPGEGTRNAANRRLKEEMGLLCDLQPAFNFTYHTEIQQGITEYEYDHVFWGITNEQPDLCLEEAIAFRYQDMADLETDIQNHPEQYTTWLKICFDRVKSHHHQYFNS
ncbi:isopentenyl-diphosphate Delta-isomerase [Mucilaginibacter sp. SG564]|uniref:isopentenyl-diphosphate Delta-isomerase n=1 Tax=Mucilaginibacter sp. SG564 TaxID=2587022 RepID=UPI0015521243|nr:isopentenyl-diphosphate Delta-isomerase [Mucilaginibacter sp. SG564]NOW94285.1 isopentenyl-diphosphate delta-isomerase [Mucilaginibacter sp. SG564]